MQKLPCEIIVWDSLPAIRAAIAAEMVASGLSQKRVADILDMAPSAISQYISGKRGYRIDFSDEVKDAITSLANDMRGGELENPGPRICEICSLIRGTESCQVCHTSHEEGEDSP